MKLIRAEDAVVRSDLPIGSGLPSWRFYCPDCRMPAIFLIPLRRRCIDCLELAIKNSAPGRGHWLYRLWNGKRLVYVGVTRNPRARIGSHWRRWGGQLFDRVTWEACADERDMLRREATAIAAEYPALNIDHPATEEQGG